MNSRRGFFRSLAQAAAIIALAPQLAFRVKPEIPIATAPLDGVYVWTLDWSDFEVSTRDLVCREHGFVSTMPYNPWQAKLMEVDHPTPEELKKLYGV